MRGSHTLDPDDLKPPVLALATCNGDAQLLTFMGGRLGHNAASLTRKRQWQLTFTCKRYSQSEGENVNAPTNKASCSYESQAKPMNTDLSKM